MERAVEAGYLRQARERRSEGAGAGDVEGLIRGLHFNKRVQIVEHGAVDQHRRFEARSAEHDTMAGSDDFRIVKMGFHPTDDVFQSGCMVDRMAFTPFVRVQRLARRVLDDKVRPARSRDSAAAGSEAESTL